jgi:hypothetical protein
VPVSRSAFACAGAAGVVASVAVAHQRIGLGLSLALILVIGAGVLAAGRRASISLATLAAALGLQPILRDAGWVVAADVVAGVIAAALAVNAPDTWRRLASALYAPFQPLRATAVIARAARIATTAGGSSHAGPVARGLGLGLSLTFVFGGLFVAADKAFADLVDQTLTLNLDAGEIIWRLLLGLWFAAVAGALASAAMTDGPPTERAPARVPGRIELRIALSAVVALFAAFVVVQLHVLFGGAKYVQETTGLGYGEYARQGFVQLLVVAALTLGVVGVAAWQRDRMVRALLGALCLLTLVVLVSAYHRLHLVEDAYGLTRVRYSGDAIVAWFVVMFGLVLAAGVHGGVARTLPRIATFVTLAGVLAFSLSNPDRRIADSAVSRAASGRPVDTNYIADLSADALPALERLPEPERAIVVSSVRARLARPDGIAGANLARARAR